MAKKNIIKLNDQYFSCNRIENFDDTSKINAEVEVEVEVETETSQEEPPIKVKLHSDDQQLKLHSDDHPKTKGGICMTNPDDWSDETRKKCTDDDTNEDSTPKKRYRTRVGSKKRSLKGSKRGSRKGSKKGSRKGSRKGSKKGSKKRSKKGSKKRSKKNTEGFCAGNTCLTESNLKSLIKLLKKLELKK